jgi:hypothetical protein
VTKIQEDPRTHLVAVVMTSDFPEEEGVKELDKDLNNILKQNEEDEVEGVLRSWDVI